MITVQSDQLHHHHHHQGHTCHHQVGTQTQIVHFSDTVTGNTITSSYTDLCVPRAQVLELSNYSRYTRVTSPAAGGKYEYY